MEIWEKGNVTIDDVPIIREYLDVFPEDFPRVPPERKVDFRIDLVLGTAKIAKASSPVSPSKYVGVVYIIAVAVRQGVHSTELYATGRVHTVCEEEG